MAGIKKELGPTGRRVAEALNRFRRGSKVTTAELSRRLTALGQPIPDTGITKAEQGTRRVDVDDLVAISLALGVTPNTLMLPHVDYLGGMDYHQLTPEADAGAERLWQWAQGERPLRVPVPGADGWIGGGEHPALQFSIRNRPYLTALHSPAGSGTGLPPPYMRDLSFAVAKAMEGGASPSEVRRTVELTIALPVVMTREEIQAWLKDGTRPEEKP